jgi:S1-C subfamily serine protease
MLRTSEKVIFSCLLLLFCVVVALTVIVVRQANTISSSDWLSSYEDKWVEVYNYNAPSVVVVQCFLPGRPLQIGTGFFLTDDGYICTCAHVVLDSQSLESNSEFIDHSLSSIVVTVNTTDDNGKMSNPNYKATLVGFDGHGDVAVLKINTTVPTPAVTIATDITENLVAYDVMVIGCIFGVDYESCAMGNVRDQKWSDPTGHHQLSCLLTSVSTAPGNSGSPIFDNIGRCLAMHQNSFHPRNDILAFSEVKPVDPTVRLNTLDSSSESWDNVTMTMRSPNDLSSGEGNSDVLDSALMQSMGGSVTESINSGTAPADVSTVPTFSESNTAPSPKESSFGGGITAINLARIAFTIIEHARDKKTSPHIESDRNGILRYKNKGWIGVSTRTNTLINYIEVIRESDSTISLPEALRRAQETYPGGGMIIKDAPDQFLASLKPGDVITAIDGTSVGPFGYQSSIGDITYYKFPGDTVQLTIHGKPNPVIVELKPFDQLLDIPYGNLQTANLGKTEPNNTKTSQFKNFAEFTSIYKTLFQYDFFWFEEHEARAKKKMGYKSKQNQESKLYMLLKTEIDRSKEYIITKLDKTYEKVAIELSTQFKKERQVLEIPSTKYSISFDSLYQKISNTVSEKKYGSDDKTVMDNKNELVYLAEMITKQAKQANEDKIRNETTKKINSDVRAELSKVHTYDVAQRASLDAKQKYMDNKYIADRAYNSVYYVFAKHHLEYAQLSVFSKLLTLIENALIESTKEIEVVLAFQKNAMQRLGEVEELVKQYMSNTSWNQKDMQKATDEIKAAAVKLKIDSQDSKMLTEGMQFCQFTPEVALAVKDAIAIRYTAEEKPTQNFLKFYLSYELEFFPAKESYYDYYRSWEQLVLANVQDERVKYASDQKPAAVASAKYKRQLEYSKDLTEYKDVLASILAYDRSIGNLYEQVQTYATSGVVGKALLDSMGEGQLVSSVLIIPQFDKAFDLLKSSYKQLLQTDDIVRSGEDLVNTATDIEARNMLWIQSYFETTGYKWSVERKFLDKLLSTSKQRANIVIYGIILDIVRDDKLVRKLAYENFVSLINQIYPIYRKNIMIMETAKKLSVNACTIS